MVLIEHVAQDNPIDRHHSSVPVCISTQIGIFPSGGVQLSLNFPHRRDWWPEANAFRHYVELLGEGYCLGLELGTGPGVEERA